MDVQMMLSFHETYGVTTSIALLALGTALLLCVYRLYFHPLAYIPGHWLCRVTSLWTYWHAYIGDEATLITQFHDKYGPVIRVAPNEVCIADGSCLAPIYSDHGGFAKPVCYRNFDIDGFATLFSETDKDLRGPCAKSVLSLFSTASLKAGEGVLEGCVQRLVRRILAEKERSVQSGGSVKVNVLNLTRSLAVDAVTAYLFRRSYGGLEEDKIPRMSASDFVDSFVAVGRFFHLPNRIFLLLDAWSERFFSTKETHESMVKVSAYMTKVVDDSSPDDKTYPGRMLKAGLSSEEVVAQCKDLIFAGTDSTGMNLSMFCWLLARHPNIYTKLKAEVSDAKADNPQGYDAAALPFLRACIRETLRLSMAQPTRLPRVVPAGGWEFPCQTDGKTYCFPAGTLVSAQVHTLHHNASVFYNPRSFDPERWSEDSATKEMLRDFVPFGLGARRCIAQNLAMMELTLAGRAIVESGLLDGARAVSDKVEIIEWFNSKVKGERIELFWPHKENA